MVVGAEGGGGITPVSRRPARSVSEAGVAAEAVGGPTTVRTSANPAARHRLCRAAMVGTYQFPKSVRSELPAWN